MKRLEKGRASKHLHDALEPGAFVEARKPAGDFMVTCSACPLVRVSAGVGLPPMVSMLHAAVAKHREQPVWFVHGARDGRSHALAEEVRDLVGSRPNISSHVAYSRPRAEDRLGEDYDSEGRVTGALLADMVTEAGAHYFLCGPTGFMADVRADLLRRGVPPEQIHAETFGPA